MRRILSREPGDRLRGTRRSHAPFPGGGRRPRAGFAGRERRRGRATRTPRSEVVRHRRSARARARGRGGRGSVMLVQGLAKGDKMETVIRHATELGVAAFVPLACERSVVRLDAKKAAAKARSAGAPSRRARPCSRGSRRFPTCASRRACERRARCSPTRTPLLVCWEEAPARRGWTTRSTARSAAAVPAQDARVAVVVGPEGRLGRARGGGAAGLQPPRLARDARPVHPAHGDGRHRGARARRCTSSRGTRGRGAL